MAHPNEELARSEMEAAVRGDLEGMLDHYTDDAILHYPGGTRYLGLTAGRTGSGNGDVSSVSCLGKKDRSTERSMTSWRAMTTRSSLYRLRLDVRTVGGLAGMLLA